MGMIDIRGRVATTSHIQFGDESDYNAAVLSNEDGCIEFLDSDLDASRRVKFEDIDNMILALQKAKELWT